MKKSKLVLTTLLALTAGACLLGCNKQAQTTNTEKKSTEETQKKEEDFKIVTSFYPMHILLMNLTDGVDGVTEMSMSEPNIGCIHDHTFTTEDLKKVEGADAYIENGMGLEAFNDKIKEAYPDIPIVEASANISEDDINAHVWTNLDHYVTQIKEVSKQLQTLNPANKDAYAANEKEYIEKVEKLKSDNSKVIADMKGKKVLILDEAIPNFCEFLEMDTMEIETDHEEEALSADDLKESIEKMKKDGVKTILIGKDADRSAAETIAKEAGAKIYELNTCMVGTKDSKADSYLTEMKENFEIISKIE